MNRSNRNRLISFGLAVLILFAASATLGVFEKEAMNRELVRAVLDQNEDRVRILLERGASPDTRSSILRSSGGPWQQVFVRLGLRAETPDPLLERLVRMTINPDSPVLIIAASQSSRRIVALLLAFGANPNSRNGNGRTALMQAVFHSDHVVMSALLQFGADPRAKDASGNTALELAKHNGAARRVVELLAPTNLHSARQKAE